MESVTLKASTREETGKNAAGRVRREDAVPAVYYQGSDTTLNVQFSKKEFTNMHRGGTRVVTLDVEGKTYENCLIREVQRHPLTGAIEHVDLQGMTAGRKVRITLPIKFLGSPAGLRQGGQIRKLLHKATISVLPENVPQFIEVEVAELQASSTMLVRDLPKTDKYTLLVPDHVAVIQITKPRDQAE